VVIHPEGTSDRFSDVDLLVVVDPDDVENFCNAWPALCDEIAPTVFRRRVGDRPVFNQVTRDWLRFDMSLGTADTVTGRTRSTASPYMTRLASAPASARRVYEAA